MKFLERTCKAQGCGAKTRAASGLCAEHGHLVDRKVVQARGQETTLNRSVFRAKPKHGLGG